MSAAALPVIPQNKAGPMRLYVGSLHFNITEDMLRGIFEPFGKVNKLTIASLNNCFIEILIFRKLFLNILA
jgi:RNA recognition motif-containing protein